MFTRYLHGIKIMWFRAHVNFYLNLFGKKYRIKNSGQVDEKGMAVNEHIPGRIVEVY